LHDIQVIAEPAFEDQRLALVVDVAGFTDEMDFSTAASKVGDGEEVGTKVGDIENVL